VFQRRFGPLDQTDGLVRFDQLHAASYHAAVGLGPVRRDLGDWRGAVAFEPSGLLESCGHASGQDDFEGSLAQRYFHRSLKLHFVH
jgi:hypothetical protein